MVNVRKRKLPITSNENNSKGSSNPRTTRKVIRRFHTLLKKESHIQSSENSADVDERLVDIHREIDNLGGLQTYQRMSNIGQGKDRGGGSEKVLISWLRELGLYPQSHSEGKGKQRLLEVGALKPDNYTSCSSWLETTCIDLRSNHPSIVERDFLTMTDDENVSSWDIISLSLVVNFVPEAKNRGCMLELAHSLLRVHGLLFLVLPLPCVMNSRYLTLEHLENLMVCLGFEKLRERWKPTGKVIYWLFSKSGLKANLKNEDFRRKIVLRSGKRNNFCIILP